MPILDWSDPEEMLGLLADWVADELHEETTDHRRAQFLKHLASSLATLASESGHLSVRAVDEQLRGILGSQPSEFAADPALEHVRDCIHELERMGAMNMGNKK